LKEKLLTYLVCPDCGQKLLLSVARKQDDEIIEGNLNCVGCHRSFSISGGIPRFANLDQLDQDKQATAAGFGWQWTHFVQEDRRYAEQFLGWIKPVTPEFFLDKVVLEGGCGKGRHTQLAAAWGARDVIGMDLSAAVETAYVATRQLPNVHIVQADIYSLPFSRSFDYAFSVGVLHHLPDPKGGFESLASKVTPGGQLSAWVYGAENNEWITRWVNPIRENITSRMDRGILLQLSKIPAAGIYLATKLIYGPLNRSRSSEPITRHLFYNEYFKNLAPFGWREQHTIVFDHLVAPTAFYLSREEFESWWRDIGVEEVTITWHNQNSWCGFGRIPGA
jgi:SAM-dependent methyltransferase